MIGDLPFLLFLLIIRCLGTQVFLLDEPSPATLRCWCSSRLFSAQGQCGAIPFTTGCASRNRLSMSIDRLRALLAHVDAIRWITSAIRRSMHVPVAHQRLSPDNGCRAGAGLFEACTRTGPPAVHRRSSVLSLRTCRHC